MSSLKFELLEITRGDNAQFSVTFETADEEYEIDVDSGTLLNFNSFQAAVLDQFNIVLRPPTNNTGRPSELMWSAMVANAMKDDDQGDDKQSHSAGAAGKTSLMKGQSMLTQLSDELKSDSRNLALLREFNEAGGEAAVGVDAESYIRSRRIDLGYDYIGFDRQVHTKPTETASSEPKPTDDDFKREWREQGGEKTGLSEAEFVAMRRVDEGLDRLM